MHTKLKSFVLTALLFTSLSLVIAQVKPATDSVYKKSRSISDLDGKWYLQTVAEIDSPNNRVPEIQFDINLNRFSGSTGCNRMSGSFLATDSTLHISDKMITTRMFCPDYDETAFLKIFLKTDGYHFNKGWLILTSGDSVISRWSRKINPREIP